MRGLILFSCLGAILGIGVKIKPYLGVNLEGNVDWQVSNFFVDMMKSARGWGRVNQPWITDSPVDADGWPVVDSGIVIASCDGSFRCEGHYLLSFEGTADVSIYFHGPVQNKVVSNGYTYADVIIPSLPSIMLVFTNTINGVRDVKLLRPGYLRNTTKLYTDDFLLSLSPFSTVRVMDFVNTNQVNFVNNPPYYTTAIVYWSNRTLPTDAIQGGTYGVCWEYIIRLANEAKVNPWLNIPYNADDDYIAKLIELIDSTLDPSLHVYLEYSNEVWNWQFAQAGLNLWKSQRDAEANGHHLWMYAKEVVRLSNITRSIVGSLSLNTRFRVVLGIQIGWTPPPSGLCLRCLTL
jgi:hypothetical protein